MKSSDLNWITVRTLVCPAGFQVKSTLLHLRPESDRVSTTACPSLQDRSATKRHTGEISVQFSAVICMVNHVQRGTWRTYGADQSLA